MSPQSGLAGLLFHGLSKNTCIRFSTSLSHQTNIKATGARTYCWWRLGRPSFQCLSRCLLTSIVGAPWLHCLLSFGFFPSSRCTQSCMICGSWACHSHFARIPLAHIPRYLVRRLWGYGCGCSHHVNLRRLGVGISSRVLDHALGLLMWYEPLCKLLPAL